MVKRQVAWTGLLIGAVLVFGLASAGGIIVSSLYDTRPWVVPVVGVSGCLAFGPPRRLALPLSGSVVWHASSLILYGGYAYFLSSVGQMLVEFPNFYVELIVGGSVVAVVLGIVLEWTIRKGVIILFAHIPAANR